MPTLRGLVKKGAERLGYNIARKTLPTDMEPQFVQMFQRCSPFSMTSIERMYGLYGAVNHVCRQGVEGDFVECGVWQGGSAMMMACALRAAEVDRRIWLYDTFAGMTEPTADDRDFSGQSAGEKWLSKQTTDGNLWCRAGLAKVKQNMESTGHPSTSVRYIEGPVEQTLLKDAPDKIALLRLDTDWYESTKAELEVLYPRLSIGGVLIVDDYGHWQGARKAVDEYFARPDVKSPLLVRLDYTGRLAVRCV